MNNYNPMDNQQVIVPKFRLSKTDSDMMQVLLKIYYLTPAELLRRLIRKEYDGLKEDGYALPEPPPQPKKEKAAKVIETTVNPDIDTIDSQDFY